MTNDFGSKCKFYSEIWPFFYWLFFFSSLKGGDTYFET